MIEIEHENLFKPPPETSIVIIPCCGEYWDKPPATKVTPMREGYAALAKTRYKSLPVNLGVLHWRMGTTPHPLTTVKFIARKGPDGKPTHGRRIHLPGKSKMALPLQHHLVSLPTRRYEDQPIDVDFLCSKLRELDSLVMRRIEYLAVTTGKIVLPQIADPKHGKTWADFRDLVAPWLASDRYTVISGKEGLST